MQNQSCVSLIFEKNGYHIYELSVKGDDTVQGRISSKTDGGVADVEIVETAPHNYSHKGIYAGVGAHLFAIACQISLNAGCDGVVAFTSKSPTTSSTGGLILALQRAILLLAPQGGIASISTGPL